MKNLPKQRQARGQEGLRLSRSGLDRHKTHQGSSGETDPTQSVTEMMIPLVANASIDVPAHAPLAWLSALAMVHDQ
jgi:hypothetical protein